MNGDPAVATTKKRRAGARGVKPKRSGDYAESFGITCPLCGGSLRVHEGERSIHCEYCDSSLYITRPSGVRRFTMRPKITPGRAKLVALHYLSEKTGKKVKARHASIIDLKLIHVPFWRMRGRLIGWICGDKITQEKVEVPSQGPNQHTIYETLREERHPYSKLVFKHVDWSTPACTLRYLGLQGISLRTRLLDWDLFDHELKDGKIVALPMKGEKQARADAFSYLTRLTAPTGATVRASRFHLFDNNFSLYYFPVYFLRYRYGGIIYTITIDGCDGQVVRGDTPEQGAIDARNFFLVPAAFAFLAGTYLPLAFIATAAVYIHDMVQSGSLLAPHVWMAGRLDKWFGGER